MKKAVSVITAIFMIIISSVPAFSYYAPACDELGGIDARELSGVVAKEGMVLLENKNSALPLERGETVAVFGINQIDYIHGGGGSGNFLSEYYVNLIEGLEAKQDEGKIALYDGLVSTYKAVFDDYWKNDKRTYAYGSKQGAVIMYQGETAITDAMVSEAAASADTAIITIGRPAGEDGDRKSGAGDFCLSDTELNMISSVKAAGFEKIIAVLNVAGVIETDWLRDFDAALLVYFPGMEGGNAIADVLCGDAYPSGKLVDTWAKTYASYPSSSNFGNSSYANYEEDIFVGYRYFETIPSASDSVNYEFGYGLSYTDFEIGNVAVTSDDENITVSADVTNTGSLYPGKEVVQIYYSAPEVMLTQPSRELAAFVKTRELLPGESQRVTASFAINDMASYDDVGKTGYEAAYVLEAGDYGIYVGTSVRNCTLRGVYSVDETHVTEQLAHRIVPNINNITRRLKSDGKYEAITATTAAQRTPESAQALYENPPESDDNFITFNEVCADNSLLQTFVSRLGSEDLIALVGCTTPSFGHRTGIGNIPAYGIPLIGTANGPAGVQHNNGSESDPERNTTFFPCATMQASTWNVELIETLGAAMGLEAKHFGMSLWQAPGMNIHRNPLGGRNFEYFSEDPYLTGKLGAAITRGVQSQDFASQLKHFAMNNQETGRWGNDSRVSERALREIYLKGFEITVKEAHPWSVMSSYNRINGTYSSANYELLTEILRNEWGFDGFVMTDFYTSPSHLDELLAGGDLKAPAVSPNPALLRSALSDGRLSRWQLERSAERVLAFILKTRDARTLAVTPFEYSIALNISGISVSDENILITSYITQKEFMQRIDDTCNQEYLLYNGEILAAAFNEGGSGEYYFSDEDALVTAGMTLSVTAEDGSVNKTYIVSSPSLAYQASVRASATENGNPAENAVDANESTRWSAYRSENKTDGVYDNFGNWLEIDLGGVYNLAGISLLYYDDANRGYTYEIWGKESGSQWDADTSKNKDFASLGYDLIAQPQTTLSDGVADLTELDARARYIVIKTTNGSVAKAPSICEIEVSGWRLYSQTYTIDEEAHIVYMPENTLMSDAYENLNLDGRAVLTIEPNAAWVGSSLTVTDESGRDILYEIREISNTDCPLISDYTLQSDGTVTSNTLRATGTGGSYGAAADRYAVMTFDIANVSANIVSAQLSMYLATKGNHGNPVFTVYSASDASDTSTYVEILSYVSDFSSGDASNYATLTVNKWYGFDVTQAVIEAAENGSDQLILIVSADTCACNFAHSSSGSATAARLIVSQSDIRATGIEISETELDLFVGDTYQLTATVLPEDSVNKGITWSTNHFAYCSVDDGFITAKAPGTAKITVTSDDGGYSAVCRVTIIERSEFLYTVTSGKARIDGYGGNIGADFTVPSTVDGYAVSKIGSNAFAKSAIVSATIEAGIGMINYGAFAGCKSLESVAIPVTVTSIGNNAFSNCTSLTDVYYGGTEDDWTSITIGTNNDALNDATVHFADAAVLTYEVTGANAKITGYEGIIGTKLDIPTTIGGYRVTKTGSNVFFNCKLLRVVAIGNGVTTLNYGTFSNCKNMQSIIVPKTIKVIGSAAFKNCNSLEDVYYLGCEEDWANISIASGNTALTSANIHFAE